MSAGRSDRFLLETNSPYLDKHEGPWMAYENWVKAAEIIGIPTIELVKVSNTNAAKMYSLTWYVFGFINHLYLDKYISYPLYMKTALTGYNDSMARIFYVHVIGGKALLQRRDHFAAIIEITYICSRHWRKYAFTKIVHVFFGVSSSCRLCIFNLLIHILYCFFRPRISKQ